VSAKPLVIFGAGDIAELAYHYFTMDAKRQVDAFTVDRAYVGEGRFSGLSVVGFEETAARYPHASHELFVAVSYTRLNAVRKEKYLAAKAAGYTLPSYVSSKATVLNGGAIGENCFILEDDTIQPFVAFGNNVTLWSGNHIGHHSKVRDHCFLASQIVISGGVEIGESCFIGVNATLRDHIRIGERCVIGAGALLLADAEPEGVYMAEATARSRVPSNRLKKL
jgi:sugar O-acyltransferase (sialic acid O-acetyltransferase NeuD family)